MTDIKAVILMAGKGTRMKEETTPKVLHQILGKTLLGYVLDNVKNFVSEEFVIVGHHAEEVEKYVKTNYPEAKILQIEKDRYEYEVRLSNFWDLKFDLKFNLIDMDRDDD